MDKIIHKMQLTGFSTKELENYGIFSGYASVFNCVDFQNDQVMPGAFKNTLNNWQIKSELPKMLWQHDHAIPVGKWLEIYEDDVGLFAKGQLLETSAGKDAYKLLKNKVVDGLSIGFSLQKSSRCNKGHKLLQEVDLHEISLVTFAANPKAKVLWVKSAKEELIKRLSRLHEKIEKMHIILAR